MIYDQLADRSMLIVAHRLSTVRDCDHDPCDGSRQDRGTRHHDELLAKEGKYYELWNMQQGIYRSKKRQSPSSLSCRPWWKRMTTVSRLPIDVLQPGAYPVTYERESFMMDSLI